MTPTCTQMTRHWTEMRLWKEQAGRGRWNGVNMSKNQEFSGGHNEFEVPVSI